jgi:hypothetical protein
MAKYALSKYFARGAGRVIRLLGSHVLLFYWHGRSDGAARFVEHVRRYTRQGIEHPSLAALLRAVEEEHRL